jgi:hypothetical protein
MMEEAKTALTWTGICRTFVIGVCNIPQVQDKEKDRSKAIRTHKAKEQDAVVQGSRRKGTAFAWTLHQRTGRPQTHKAIKWSNDQAEHTTPLPVHGISRAAMLHPLKSQKADGTGHTMTTPRDKLRAFHCGSLCQGESQQRTKDDGC